MGRDSDATKVLEVAERFPENDTYVEVTVFRVPVSDRYPEGVKYSMQYGTTAGKTLVRYDNFSDHPDAPTHHVHRADESVDPVDFDGVRALFERFKPEVHNRGENWPDDG